MGALLRAAIAGVAALVGACGGELDLPDPPGPRAGDVGLPITPASQDPADAIFDPTTIHDLALTMAPADWAAVRDNPWTKAWVRADLALDGERVDGIGVRAFGAGSLIRGKPSLKLSFDHFTRHQELRGLDELKLDNSSQDHGYLNEFTCTAAMRAAGVPAGRTGWARVTVNGEPAGFFVVLESIDDRFVQRWFGNDDGALYSMNGHAWGNGLNPMADPLVYYEPETSAGGDGSELVRAANALASGDPAAIEATVDVDGFLRESVARSVMGSLDAFSADGNNFYLYVDRGRVRVIPWDFDVDLAAWYWERATAVDPHAPWTTSPWSRNSQTGVPYTDPVLRYALARGDDVDALVHELVRGPFAFEALDAKVAAAAALIHDDVHRDVLGYGADFDQRAFDLRLFLHTRWSALAGGEVAYCPPPAAGVKRAADLAPAGTVGWGELLVDRSNWGPGFTVAGRHFCTGLFAHAPSSVQLAIPAGYGRLRGAAGLQDWRQRCGNGARFAIVQDGVELWSTAVRQNYDPALAFAIDVAPGTVTLTTSPEGEYSCDTTSWLDLELAPR